MSTTFDEKQTQRIVDLGKRVAIAHRQDGGYRDDETVRKQAALHAQSNVDDLDSGGNDPQGYIAEFVALYVKGYLDEIKFHEEMMAMGRRFSAEREEIQDKAIAAMTPQRAAEIVHAASEIIGIEYMPLLAQLENVEKWLKRMDEVK